MNFAFRQIVIIVRKVGMLNTDFVSMLSQIFFILLTSPRPRPRLVYVGTRKVSLTHVTNRLISSVRASSLLPTRRGSNNYLVLVPLPQHISALRAFFLKCVSLS